MSVGKAPRGRTQFAIPLEEEALHLIAALGDFKAERNLQLVCHDLRVPQTTKVRRGNSWPSQCHADRQDNDAERQEPSHNAEIIAPARAPQPKPKRPRTASKSD